MLKYVNFDFENFVIIVVIIITCLLLKLLKQYNVILKPLNGFLLNDKPNEMLSLKVYDDTLWRLLLISVSEWLLVYNTLLRCFGCAFTQWEFKYKHVVRCEDVFG